MSKEVGEISAFIDEFVQVFEGWSDSIEQKAKVFGRNRSCFLKESQNRVKTLNEMDERIKQEAIRSHSEQEKENEEINLVTKSLSSLKVVEDKLPTLVQQSRNEQEKLFLKLEDLMKDLSREQREKEEKLAKLQSISKVYCSRLGIEFRTIPGFVHCIFTLINASKPDQEFSFMLSLSTTSDYQITNCSPALPIEQIANITKTANKTNSLLPLMKSMRCLFKSTYL